MARIPDIVEEPKGPERQLFVTNFDTIFPSGPEKPLSVGFIALWQFIHQSRPVEPLVQTAIVFPAQSIKDIAALPRNGVAQPDIELALDEELHPAGINVLRAIRAGWDETKHGLVVPFTSVVYAGHEPTVHGSFAEDTGARFVTITNDEGSEADAGWAYVSQMLIDGPTISADVINE